MVKPAANSAPTLSPTFKYGMPVYGLAWPEGDTIYMCGGGGAASTGIKNRVVCAQRVQGMLTDQVAEFQCGLDCPMRLAIAPSGKSLVLGMGKGGIKRIDIDTRGKAPKLSEVSGDLAERIAKAVGPGEVGCLCFSPSGDQLCVGGDKGELHVVDWPSMKTRLHLSGDTKLADNPRDVSMAATTRTGGSSSSARVAVVLENGKLEIWDWEAGSLVCKAGLQRMELKTDGVIAMSGPNITSCQTLPKGMHGVTFTRARFAPAAPSSNTNNSQPSTEGASGSQGSTAAGGSNEQLLHALMNNRKGCWVTTWAVVPATGMLRLVRYKLASEAPGACLDVSRCGTLLAVGTSEGASMVLRASDLSTQHALPKAHMVFCTGVCVSPDSQHIISVSADASATLLPTAAPAKPKLGWQRTITLCMILLAMLLLCTLQALRVLKAYGRTDVVYQIRQMLGWTGAMGAQRAPAGHSGSFSSGHMKGNMHGYKSEL